jgi:hypothetical protein
MVSFKPSMLLWLALGWGCTSMSGEFEPGADVGAVLGPALKPEAPIGFSSSSVDIPALQQYHHPLIFYIGFAFFQSTNTWHSL